MKLKIFNNPLRYTGDFILNTETPKFLARVAPEADGINIEAIRLFDKSDIDALEGAKLMRQTGEWYREYGNFPKKTPAGVPAYMLNQPTQADETEDKHEYFIFSGKQGKEALLKVKYMPYKEVGKTPEYLHHFTIMHESLEDGYPEFHEIRIAENYNIPDNKIKVVLKNAGKWFKSVLIAEDRQTYSEPAEPFLQDFNDQVNNLKILGFPGFVILSFRGRVQRFETVEDAIFHVVSEYNIPEEKLTEGNVNVLK